LCSFGVCLTQEDDALLSEFKSSGSYRIDRLSAADALGSLNSTPQGLSAAEARRRLREFGPNHVEEMRHEHLLLRFLKGLTHFFALILWVAAALAFFAEWRAFGEGMAKIGYAIVVVILVSAVFAFWQEDVRCGNHHPATTIWSNPSAYESFEAHEGRHHASVTAAVASFPEPLWHTRPRQPAQPPP
jgi:Cation transporter/ATPase, N-terminus